MKSENTKESNEIITDTPKPKSCGSIFTIGGSRAELLNGLDGITPPHEVLIILSSNHPDKLYKSIYRNGRVDEYIHVDYLKKEEIKSVLGWKDDNPLFEPIAEYDKGLSASSLSRLRHAKNISDVIKILDKNTKAQSISTEVFDI
jgi:ATP-dependent 26S proteasome regulatory subunit